MTKKTLKQVCTCENCGNEAEMQVTCEWKEEEKTETSSAKPEKKHVKGVGVCSKCGNEADIWVDI